jgi:phenylpropionate dioxygenase-like ring-hydroxylating dioxygenase large terminal subunit
MATQTVREKLAGIDPVLKNEWHVVARPEDVPDGRTCGVRLLGQPIVLWRADGRIRAAYDLCFHRGTRLTAEGNRVEPVSKSGVNGDCLICPYHGWHYDSTGQCVYIPAAPQQKPPRKAHLVSFHVEERYGWVWVCIGVPEHDIPLIPEWGDASFRKVLWGPRPVPAAGPRLVENFLDIAHFPYVHEGYLGDLDHTEIDDYTATLTAGGLVTSEIRVWQPDPDGTGIGTYSAYVYKVFRPLVGYFVKQTGGRFSIFFAVTPVEPRLSVAWMCISMDYSAEMTDQEVRAFQDTIFDQDVPVVTAQFPEELPLDLAEEISARADHLSIRYRQWLDELGMTYGVTPRDTEITSA